MWFIVWPKSNQLTAIGNAMDEFAAVHFRGVESAAAASTHAGRKEVEQDRSGNQPGQLQSVCWREGSNSRTDLDGQLNFEFRRIKNSMAAFMNRLRRVYQT
jgi:hypothetical protein